MIAVDLSAEKLALAKAFGADATVLSDDRAVEHVRDLCGGRAELILDVVGSDATLQLAVSVSRRLGHLTVVGIAGGSFPYSYLLVPTELAVTSSFYGSIPELSEVVALAAAGAIKAEVELFPLEQTALAYERLREGKVRGRAVVIPNG